MLNNDRESNASTNFMGNGDNTRGLENVNIEGMPAELQTLQEDVQRQLREQEAMWMCRTIRQQQEEIKRINSPMASQRQRSQPNLSSEDRGGKRRSIINLKVSEPPTLDECSCFDMYKKKLRLWEMTSDIPVHKMGALNIHSLPDKSEFKNGLAV